MDKSNGVRSFDFSAVHTSHPLADYCRQLGIELRRVGNNLIGLCPLHKESTPSFTVYPDNHYHCFGCGAHGDIIDLERALRGGTVRDAVERLGAAATVVPSATNLKPTAPVRIPAYQLTNLDRELVSEAAFTLLQNPELALRIRAKLPLAAVEHAAFEGSLGYCRELTFAAIGDPALLFRYKHGVKVRWPGKVVRWISGAPFGTCWRQDLLLESHGRIYLTEGEVDALCLLSITGVERFCESLVLALPSATSLPDPTPFDGREIVLVPDADQAGKKCVAKLARLLEPVVKSIGVIDLGGS